MKFKFALVGLTALGSLAAGGTASAMPAATSDALGRADGAVIQVKGGHGHGGGHGWGHRGGRGHHYGWGRGHGHHYGWRHHRHWW